jgi:hypothetical protein
MKGDQFNWSKLSIEKEREKQNPMCGGKCIARDFILPIRTQ